jgi:hypothetical protein
MDRRTNPFVPGPGAVPPELVGREREAEDFAVLIDRAMAGRVSAPMVMYGLRGVGKTVLLESFAAHAEEAGWLTASIEAGLGPSATSTAAQLSRELRRIAHKLKHGDHPGRFARALEAIESLSVSVGLTGGSVSVERRDTNGPATHAPIDLELLDVVEDLVPELTRDHTGLVIFVDEMQDVDDATLSALVSTQHRATQRNWPFYVIGAGLPSVRRRLGDIRSYTERYAFRCLGQLSDGQARAALAEPAGRRNVRFADAALTHLVEEADGYPYFLQAFGYQAWSLAEGDTITAADADQAVTAAWEELDEGFFMTRWDRASETERLYLRAMLDAGDQPTGTGDIAKRLGKTPNQVSTTRANLIEKGLLYVPERGKLAFTVPGIAGFLARHPAL